MSNSVKKRETFYLAGYDPRGARHYYNLYKKEAALQSEINGIKMDISSRKRTGKHMQSWHIESQSDEGVTHTNYNFLEWDDIIRKRWNSTTLSIFKDLYYYMKTYMFTGLIVKFGKLSPNQMGPAFFPVLYLFLAVLFSVLIWSFTDSLLSAYLPMYVSVLISLIPAYLFIQQSIKFGEKIAVFWLLRIYVFSAKYVFEVMDTLHKRMDSFASDIISAIKNVDENDTDEVLIVGHSVGSILAIPVMARVLASSDLPKESLAKVSILTLGECIPLVSFLEEAKDFKSDMKSIALREEIVWLDYTAPIDGACFPLLDYYKHSGVDEQGPVYLSPRFHTLYEKENYEKIKKDKYLTHFLYLMATDIEGVYDYFKMTAGTERLLSFHKKGK